MCVCVFVCVCVCLFVWPFQDQEQRAQSLHTQQLSLQTELVSLQTEVDSLRLDNKDMKVLREFVCYLLVGLIVILVCLLSFSSLGSFVNLVCCSFQAKLEKAEEYGCSRFWTAACGCHVVVNFFVGVC